MQNKFQNLQNKFQSTVQDLNSNIRQQLNKARQGSDGTDEKQYVRIPVETAKQLRWYDSGDLKLLLQVHLSEKHQLYMANAALREALENARERSGSATSVEHVNKQIDRMVEKDASLGELLVISASHEIDRLRASMQSAEQPAPSQHSDHSGTQEALCVLRTAQEAQYRAEIARASAEEKLEKYQKVSCTQQAEIDKLTSERESQEVHVAKLQARVKVLEQELQDSMKRGKLQENTSKSQKEMTSKISDLLKKNESLSNAVTLEVEKNKRLEQRLHSNEVSLSKALAETSELEYVMHERDELQAKVAYFEASMCEMKAKQVADVDVLDRLHMAEKQLKETQQELLSTAKVAAAMENDMNRALEALDKMKIEKEKDGGVSLTDDDQDLNLEDRATWPPMALEEIDMAEIRIRALHASNETNKAKLTLCQEECNSLRDKLQETEARLQDLHISQENWRVFSESQINRLEAALIVASQKAEELQVRNKKLEKMVQDSNAHASHNLQGYSSQEQLNDTDKIYTKNIILKYIQCCLEGRMQECEVLLPAIKAVLHIPQGEYNIMKRQLEDAQSLFHWMPSLK